MRDCLKDLPVRYPASKRDIEVDETIGAVRIKSSGDVLPPSWGTLQAELQTLLKGTGELP